ncbi:hypothetical protein ONZ43_g4468 [Nemania bipapillata]|uniref:Uncharacterized protein n=1 Tax=Nemania bipapillata TaxID=110536 RepID=A0ACC2IM93_9PEZI|nr:hypothetical protein ONZ43_g4468 [Nemania bipapillata]
MSAPDNKQFARATVWSDGVNQYTSLGQNPSLDDADDNMDSEVGVDGETDRWLNALENIQSSRTAPVTADEIDEAVAFRSDALPSSINSLIAIRSASAGYPGLWNSDYRNPAWGNIIHLEDDIEAERSEWLDANTERLREHFYECPYHIWPIDTGGHWEVIFMVLEKDDEHPTQYRKLIAYAVVDPLVSGGLSGSPQG